MKCICSNDWVKSYDVEYDYILSKTLPHEEECESQFLEELRAFRDSQILQRWKWVTATNESCGSRYSHGPHGECSGLAFDRT